MMEPILDLEMWAVTHGTHFAMLLGARAAYGVRVIDHIEAMADEEVRAVVAQVIVDSLATRPAVLHDAALWIGSQRVSDRGLLYSLLIAWSGQGAADD